MLWGFHNLVLSCTFYNLQFTCYELLIAVAIGYLYLICHLQFRALAQITPCFKNNLPLKTTIFSTLLHTHGHTNRQHIRIYRYVSQTKINIMKFVTHWKWVYFISSLGLKRALINSMKDFYGVKVSTEIQTKDFQYKVSLTTPNSAISTNQQDFQYLDG